MQDCSKYDIMLSARLDGTLNKKDARELEKHLAECAECRKYLQLLETVKDGLREGKIIVLATQVTHEGSDMSIYEVGKVLRDSVHLIEAYDMTLEATVAKTMWALPLSRDYEEFRTLFCRTVNHDMLLQST